jgi:hypothetical protein
MAGYLGQKPTSSPLTTADLGDNIVTNVKLADNAVGLAEMAPGTDGNIITYDASGNPTATATGTAGQVLTSAGAGAPPTFADAAAGGKVLQVVTNHVTNVSSTAHLTRTATSITGLNATITPASTGSKILIQINWCGEHSAAAIQDYLFGIKRGTTNIGDGVDVNGNGIGMTVNSGGYATEAGSSMDFACYQYIDSPSTTSATTYHAHIYGSIGTGTLHTNRTAVDGSSNFAYERAASSITLTELSSATILLNGS